MTDTIKVSLVDDEPIIRKAIRYELSAQQATVDCRVDDQGNVQRRPVEVIDTFADGVQLFAALADYPSRRPDYLLLDMELQGEPTAGLAIAERMQRLYGESSMQPIRVIILSGRFDNALPSDQGRLSRMEEIGHVLFEALHRGVRAFVSKNAVGGFSTENILHAISSLERGEAFYFNYPVMQTLKEAAELYFAQRRRSEPAEALTETERQLLLLEAAGCTAQEIASSLPGLSETDKSVQDKQKEISRKLGIVNKSGARIARAVQCGLLNLDEVNYLKR